MKNIAAALFTLMLAAAPVHAQSAAPCTPHAGQRLIRPIAATHTLPPYSRLAEQMREAGTSLLKVVVGVDGVPVDVSIYKSSGSLRLDRAAIAHVKAVWKWQPPLAEDCTPISAAILVSIVWRVEDAQLGALRYSELFMAQSDYPAGAAARKEQGFVMLVAKVPPDGGEAQVTVENGSGFPDLDDKAVEIVKARYRKPAKTNGVPMTSGVLAVWTLPLPAVK